jgi:glycosyltransferase involved in cell wall biosynthesis
MRLIAILRQLRPDVVLSTIGHLNLTLLLIRPFLPRKTRVFVRESNVPSMSFSDSFKLRLYRHLYPFLYPRADVVICPGQGIKEDLCKNFRISEEKIVTIPNPVEAEEIWKNRKSYSNPYRQGLINLLAAGSLTRQKGFDLLIKAFVAVKKNIPSINLTILDGPEERKLKTLASSLGVEDSVLFPGFQGNPYPYFFHADLFVLSSRWEGLPNVVLESLACGTPVVAFECKGCVSEIFDDASQGALVPPGDIEALGKTIISWLEGHNIVNKKQLLPRRFYLEEVVRQYEHILGSD